ncbi:glycerate kinase, partial [bacterium]|nr:glycerate kinase [bacterium]
KGCRKFIIGIGGSATTDCGTGMAQALGARFFNRENAEIIDSMCGGLLADVERVDLSGIIPEIGESTFTVACDVDNPLLGPKGCSYVYGPQKGATLAIVEQLEANMTGFAAVLEKTVGKPIRDIPGAGAAGGLGAGLIAFTGAQLKLGIDIVLEASAFADKIQDAALILTGEGRIDFQTAFGKTMSGIGREAQKAGIPVVGLGGMVDHDIDNLYEIGLTAFFSICNQPMALEQAMKNAAPLIEVVTERIIRTATISFT